MLPALPELASGHIGKKRVVADIFAKVSENILFLNRSVKSINLETKQVIDENGEYPYDKLIIAAGSTTNHHGFTNHLNMVHPLSSINDALSLNYCLNRYFSMRKKAHVVIAGGGYTGLETAVAIRQFIGQPTHFLSITVLEASPQILPFLDNKDRTFISRKFSKMRINIRTGERIERFDGHNIITSSGHRIDDALLIWTAGSRFPDISITGNIPRLPDGRIVVSDDMSIPGYNHIFAVGDSAAILNNKVPLRKSVHAAIKSGKLAGENIIRDLDGKKRRNFSYRDPGWIIPMGDASIGYLFNRIRLKGKKAHRLHYFMTGLRNYNFSNFLFFTGKALSPWKKTKLRS
jgi:NADH dehydrogenase